MMKIYIFWFNFSFYSFLNAIKHTVFTRISNKGKQNIILCMW